jgi:transcriptional regulator with XRE-family HTH domain
MACQPYVSQAELARRLGDEHGKNQNISNAEGHDPRVPRPDTILRIAEALRTTPKELMNDVVTPYDVLRAATDIDLARHQLQQFELARTKKKKGAVSTAVGTSAFRLGHRPKKSHHA